MNPEFKILEIDSKEVDIFLDPHTKLSEVCNAIRDRTAARMVAAGLFDLLVIKTPLNGGGYVRIVFKANNTGNMFFRGN